VEEESTASVGDSDGSDGTVANNSMTASTAEKLGRRQILKLFEYKAEDDV
jgi:hypothetical protein